MTEPATPPAGSASRVRGNGHHVLLTGPSPESEARRTAPRGLPPGNQVKVGNRRGQCRSQPRSRRYSRSSKARELPAPSQDNGRRRVGHPAPPGATAGPGKLRRPRPQWESPDLPSPRPWDVQRHQTKRPTPLGGGKGATSRTHARARRADRAARAASSLAQSVPVADATVNRKTRPRGAGAATSTWRPEPPPAPATKQERPRGAGAQRPPVRSGCRQSQLCTSQGNHEGPQEPLTLSK